MSWQFTWLTSDILIDVVVLSMVAAIVMVCRKPRLRRQWQVLFTRPMTVIAMLLLMCYLVIGLLDSVHMRFTAEGGVAHHQLTGVHSLLDVLLPQMMTANEPSYSAPMATHSYSQMSQLTDQGFVRDFQRLPFVGHYLLFNSKHQYLTSMLVLTAKGLFFAALFLGVIGYGCLAWLACRWRCGYSAVVKRLWSGKTKVCWRTIIITTMLLCLLLSILWQFASHYHLLGTDKVGRDILYENLKSIRTGLLIGTLTTLMMLPFALIFGLAAGYFSGWLDDVIQYVYITLSSIPSVLLITATILASQVYLSNHPHWFASSIERADLRLLLLCAVLGITSWTSLCRLIRAETLKLKQLDFVKAAKTLGVGHIRILLKHILPNTFYIILITLVLDFSGLVLAEAVLSYVGVGVDPTMMSWGNMINAGRLELARDPVVWWPLLSALVFMLGLVLSANIVADAVRDILDPTLRHVD